MYFRQLVEAGPAVDAEGDHSRIIHSGIIEDGLTGKPPLYKVLLLNDDFTPMEFVVILLMKIFGMSQEKAKQVTLHVHTRGVGVCGVFPREIAETKVRMTTDFAFQNQHPLKCTMEKE